MNLLKKLFILLLCRKLRHAATFTRKEVDTSFTGFDSGSEFADYLEQLIPDIREDNISDKDLFRLWQIFAPTGDWDELSNDSNTGDFISWLLNRLYRKRLRQIISGDRKQFFRKCASGLFVAGSCCIYLTDDENSSLYPWVIDMVSGMIRKQIPHCKISSDFMIFARRDDRNDCAAINCAGKVIVYHYQLGNRYFIDILRKFPSIQEFLAYAKQESDDYNKSS